MELKFILAIPQSSQINWRFKIQHAHCVINNRIYKITRTLHEL